MPVIEHRINCEINPGNDHLVVLILRLLNSLECIDWGFVFTATLILRKHCLDYTGVLNTYKCSAFLWKGYYEDLRICFRLYDV